MPVGVGPCCVVPAECVICSAHPGSDYSYPSFVSTGSRQGPSFTRKHTPDAPVFPQFFFYCSASFVVDLGGRLGRNR